MLNRGHYPYKSAWFYDVENNFEAVGEKDFQRRRATLYYYSGSSLPARTVGRVGGAKPSSLCLAAGAAGAGATRPDPVGHVAGWANGGSLPHHWAGGQCAAVSLVSGVSWAARWCAGSPALTNSADPLASRLGEALG